MKNRRTPWTGNQVRDFIDWHELTIQRYPVEVKIELTQYRTKWLSKVRVTENENGRA